MTSPKRLAAELKPGFWSCYHLAKACSSHGGVVTLYISNRIAALITALGLRLDWHPSYLSLSSVAAAAIGSIGIISFAQNAHSWWAPGWLALVCWTLAYAFDCADGQLARATGKKSEFGAAVDVLADYVSQLLIVTALAVIGTELQKIPLAFIAVMCGLWFFGTFAEVLRRTRVGEGHSLMGSRWPAGVLRSLFDTGFVNLALGLWVLISPETVLIPAAALTALNAGYLLASLARETRMSLRV